ncbi:MAG: arylsulfatase [Gammaproteobacteria bacterium]|nr:MAG: arylsulfatase [Gammaproteobacteria bacterium]
MQMNWIGLYMLMASLFVAGFSSAAPSSPPNIILILADDIGYSDIGCYGGEIRTPNLDALAARGLRFTQFYNGARCCPSRAAILTGLYAHRAGMGAMNHQNFSEGYQGGIHDQCATLGDVLRAADYKTYMAGKWHVLIETDMEQHKENWPLQRGFDRFYGTLLGYGSFYKPKTLVSGDTMVGLDGLEPDYYYTDAISDTTVRYIDEHLKEDPNKPFFCYVAYTAAHWPLHAKPQDIERYADTYTMGWDVIREQRHKRMMELGVIGKQSKLTVRDAKVPAWDTLKPSQQKKSAKKMAVYAAMIDSLDQGIGRIVEKLKESGQLENTLIVFLSDNGACPEKGPLGWDKKSKELSDLGSEASYSSYGFGWSNASNTPFREHKHWVHEGGIRTPFIASWPAGIPARNEFCSQIGHIIDVMPTFIEASGATYPETLNGKAIHPYQGVSLQPAFKNQPLKRKALFWEHETNCAVRQEQWKLVAKERNGPDDPWELYNMDADPTETQNLAGKYPEKVETMAAMWNKWAGENGVLPMLDRPKWFYGPPKKKK